MIKCEIIVDGYLYGITNDLKNWDDVMVSIKRGNYDGVVRSFSSKFEFVNSAYAILKKQFRDKYLGAAATIVISRRNNSWTWNELFRCSLDFSTYEDDGRTLFINAIDDSLASLIKAKRGTKYEYSMDVIKDDKKLWYDGLEMSESVNWQVSGNSIDGSTDVDVPISAQIREQVFPLYVGSSEQNVGNRFLIGDTPPGLISDKPDSYLIKSISSGGMEVHVDMTVRIPDGKYFSIILRRYYKETTGEDDYDNLAEAGVTTGDVNRNVTLSFDGGLYMEDGSYLVVVFKSAHDFTIRIPDSAVFTAKWISRVNPVNIDVVSPLNLLNRLLQSMNGGEEGLVGEIDMDWSFRVKHCLILAADSIRGVPNAKLYSSFNQFSEWMSAVFGFVYEVSGNKVVFKHRTLFFSSDIVKSIANYDEFSYTVNPSIIYSRVRVGYEKQEYDSINGRDEFRFTTTYSTGVSLTDNSLDLISPYRADAYGVEFLVQKRGEDTTDSSSDNDVFFCGAELSFNGDRYELIRNGFNLSGVISSSTMFNAMYSPRSMLVANSSFVGSCTGLLTYTSGEGNTDVAVNGINEKDDLVIPESDRLFTVGEVSFVTPEYDLPESCLGTVELKGANETYYGYMMKAEMSIGREECTKYSLMVKKIIN